MEGGEVDELAAAGAGVAGLRREEVVRYRLVHDSVRLRPRQRRHLHLQTFVFFFASAALFIGGHVREYLRPRGQTTDRGQMTDKEERLRTGRRKRKSAA